MFVQVIQGKVTDRAALRTAMDRWLSEVEPSSIGWLGSTGGVTEDGRFLLFARFTSEEEAMRNSDRPEQSAWWAETSKLFEGNATFKNSIAVDEDLVGNPDDAGFVQFVLGRMRDPERRPSLDEEARSTGLDGIATRLAGDGDGSPRGWRNDDGGLLHVGEGRSRRGSKRDSGGAHERYGGNQ
jgi:hypothetical protein